MAPRSQHEFVLFTLFIACLRAAPSVAQAPPGDYLSEIAAARKEAIQSETVSIEKLNLGEPRPGKNRFTAVAKNKTDQIITLFLDLRADPGVIMRKWQSQFLFLLWPRGEREIEAEYEFPHLSPEAWLRVRFAFPEVKQGGITDVSSFFFERKYYVGRGNKAVDFDLEKRVTEHFQIYYFPKSLAAKEINTIAEQREAAFRKISEMLGISYPQAIRLFLFPDAETKKSVTGHIGAGWAFDNNMVEIYNEMTQLDPYHELTHILAAQLGDPPAMFNEGFAVYVSELMGADALKHLGSPGKKIEDAVVARRREKKLIPLNELFAFTEIGSEESRPDTSYPEAASVVKYLVEKYGLEKFRAAYKSLQNSSDPQIIQKNKQAFREIYGKLPVEMEAEWLENLPPEQR